MPIFVRRPPRVEAIQVPKDGTISDELWDFLRRHGITTIQRGAASKGDILVLTDTWEVGNPNKIEVNRGWWLLSVPRNPDTTFGEHGYKRVQVLSPQDFHQEFMPYIHNEPRQVSPETSGHMRPEDYGGITLGHVPIRMEVRKVEEGEE